MEKLLYFLQILPGHVLLESTEALRSPAPYGGAGEFLNPFSSGRVPLLIFVHIFLVILGNFKLFILAKEGKGYAFECHVIRW